MKKKFFGSLITLLIVIGLMPVVTSVDTGSPIGVIIRTEQFAPLIWMDPDTRIVLDDNVETGRFSGPGEELLERTFNYAFEGEQIVWDVLVMDKNGIEKISDVFVTVSPVQDATSADREANCQLSNILSATDIVPVGYNARLDQQLLSGSVAGYDNVFAEYTCTLTVETPESMYEEYWVSVTVEDLDGFTNSFDENEYWFLNPTIVLDVSGGVDFGIDIRPGTTRYSDTITVGNDADAGSGVMLDMFITGTDFYDLANSGAKCPTTNQLALTSFGYFATNGAYSSNDDTVTDSGGTVIRALDAESYVNIEYGNRFSTALYDDAEILQAQLIGPYYTANLLTPGSEMSITFKLNLPEPCNGDFDSGTIYFWGEAI